MSSLADVAPDWVTLRAQTETDLPIVILVDRGTALGAPWPEASVQIGVAVPLSPTADGQPDPKDLAGLRGFEQRLVDAAAGQARLVAVMTVEGIREWVLYGSSGDWTEPFVQEGLSVVVEPDPQWTGLRELTGESLQP